MHRVIAIVAVTVAAFFLFAVPLRASAVAPVPQSAPKVTEEKADMKVNFYTLDRQKANKGEFVGTAELKNGKLETTVTDPKLKKVLESPYQTMAGVVKNGVAYDGQVTYQPGTKEHLQSIAIECYRFGYIGEITDK